MTRDANQSDAKETNRLTAEQHLAVLNAIPAHVALLDNNGVILAVNEAWRHFASANTLQSSDFSVGQNYLAVCEGAHGECADEAMAVATGIRKVLSGEAKEFGMEYPCHSPDVKRWYRLMVTPFSEIPGAGAVVMHVDVTQRRLAEEAIRSQARELAEAGQTQTAVSQALAAYVERGDWKAAMGRLLQCALDQTKSEYGFIGVVIGSKLRVLAHEGIVWDKIINREFYEQALRNYEEVGYLEFTNFNNLFGRAITTGKVVIANMPDSDPRSSGRPTGHPPMRSFLGVPIFVGDQVQGMVALANRPGGYSEEEQRRIETLVQHAGGLCTSYRQRAAAMVLEQERAKVEAALAESQRQYRDLVDTSYNVIWSVDMEGRFTFLNQASRAVFGRAPEEMIGRRFHEFVPEDQHQANDEIFAQLFRDGQDVIDYSNRIRRDDGSIAILNSNARVVLDAEGQRIGISGMSQDCTENVRAQEAIAQSEARFRGLFDQAAVGMCLVSTEGNFLRANARFCEIVGYSTAELLQRDCIATTHPDEREMEAKIVARIRAGELQGHTWEKRYVHKAGHAVWCNLTLSLLPGSSGQPAQFVAVVEDISARRAAVEQLHQREQLLGIAGKVAQMGGWSVDFPEVRISWSDEVCAIHDMPAGSVPALDQALNFYVPESRHLIESAFSCCVSEGTPFDLELEVLTAKGRRIWVRSIGQAERNEAGVIQRVQGAFQDITDHKLAQNKFQQSESLRRIAGAIGKIGGWSISVPDSRLYWSEEIFDIVEYPRGPVPSLEKALELYPEPWQSQLGAAIATCATEGTPFEQELMIKSAKGRLFWARCKAEAELNEKGSIIAVRGAFQDISEQKAAQLEITSTNRALKMLSAGNEALIHAVDERDLLKVICDIAMGSGGYRMAWVGFAQEDAKRTIRPMAHSGEEAGYLSDITISWEENTPAGRGPAGRTIRTGQPQMCADMEQDASFIWSDLARQRGYRSVICLPLRNGNSTFGLLGLYSAEVLQVSAEELKLLQELADNLAFGIGHLRAQRESERIHNVVTKVSTAVTASTGVAFFEQLAESMAETMGAAAGFVAEILPDEPYGARTVAAVVDGKKIENFNYSIPETPCVHLVAEDECVIPDRVAELFPRASNLASLGAKAYVGRSLLNAAGEKIGLIFVLFREPLKETAFITSTLRIFAARATSELERQKSDKQLREQAALLDAAHDAILVRDLDNRVVYWNKGAERLYGWAADEVIERQTSGFLYGDLTAFEGAMKVVLSKGRWEGEMRNLGKDGRTILVQASWTLLRDSDGRPSSVLAINSDLTEKKKLEEQFLRAQRMESIGTMAGGIAHDLNNVLAPILLSVEMLKLTCEDEGAQKTLVTLQNSVERGANLVSQVLNFARGVEGQRVPVNVGHLIHDLVKVMQETFPKNLTIEHNPAANLWNVIGDPTQIHQVLLNLCVNARDAMPTGGTLMIGAESIVIDESYASMNLNARAGSYVVIKVGDSGTGIPQEIQERVFEPFFTTKETGKGTGLGLSTTAAVVKGHNGFINLYSEVGKGTKFRVYLPADASQEAIEEQSIEQTRLPRGKGELILVVDDEENIRNVAKSTLERFGYSVMVAAHGAEAIAIYVQNQSAISVILTDMAMPIMDGPTMIIALKSINPDVRIIGSSGMTANGVLAKAVGAGVEHFVPKPYSADVLLKTIRAILDSE